MRLTDEEADQLVTSIGSYAQKSGKLYLYGSRADDEKKGGDIDLLLIVSSIETSHAFNKIKYIILTDIKEVVGDQRIDLSILTEEEVNASPFFRLALSTSVLLIDYTSAKEGQS